MRFLPFYSFCILLTAASWLPADVVQLENGARLVGEITPTDSRTTLTVVLEGGGRVTVNRRQVASVATESPALVEYRKRAPTAPDTVESQFALALWCKERKLIDQYRQHLERVVQLDPQNEKARNLLGYQQHGGRWLTREQLMASRGMVRYNGDFRTRQEIALLERNQKSKKANADWKNRLDRWRRNLDDRDPARSAEAIAGFRDLKESSAGPALAKLLLKERNENAKALLIQASAQVRHGATVTALAKLALEDDDEETRIACLEHLQRAETPGLNEPFVRALKSKDNEMVNRAAVALEHLRSGGAVSPLIDALVTEHKFQVGAASSGGSRYDIQGGSGVFSFGGDGAKIVKQKLRNPKVLSALVEITSENFGYEQERWRSWLAERAKEAPIDLRRDQ